MSANSEYKIKNVVVSTDGHKEIYFDVEWEGNEELGYFELRVMENGKDYCLEILAYPSHQQRVVVKNYHFFEFWRTNKENKCTIFVELGIPEYNDNGDQLSWTSLAEYEPIELNIYYESHIFRKDVIELRNL